MSKCIISKATTAEQAVQASDRTFFQQHPRRNFRLRPAFTVEIEQLASDELLPEGFCWWVVIKQIEPGIRCRWPFGAPHSLPTEVSENTARDMWSIIENSP